MSVRLTMSVGLQTLSETIYETCRDPESSEGYLDHFFRRFQPFGRSYTVFRARFVNGTETDLTVLVQV
jgi:transposase